MYFYAFFCSEQFIDFILSYKLHEDDKDIS